MTKQVWMLRTMLPQQAATARKTTVSPSPSVHQQGKVGAEGDGVENEYPSNQVIIPPRSFNSLIFSHDSVRKSSRSKAIEGELYFYEHVPQPLRYLFPKLLNFKTSLKRHPSEEIAFEIQRIHGVPLSALFTTVQLRNESVKTVVRNLHNVHSYPCVESSHECFRNNHDLIYLNHGKKVKSRFELHESMYYTLNLTFSNHFNHLVHYLDDYQRNDRGHFCNIIHGDPVLTNILLSEGKLVFIDMRGSQGDILTLAGDAVYDLAKVYQSLLGYDFILSDVRITDTVAAYVDDLIQHFWNEVDIHYPRVSWRDVLVVCCGLLSSLIPLHDNERHRRQFAKQAKLLLLEIQALQVQVGYALKRRIRTVHQRMLDSSYETQTNDDDEMKL